MDHSITTIPINLKWNQRTFEKVLSIKKGKTSSDELKQHIQTLTGVPIHRQKLLCKQGWKGMLKDGIQLLDNNTIGDDEFVQKAISYIEKKSFLTVTLIGSAEVLVEPKQPTTFLEDVTPEESAANAARDELMALEKCEGMIVPLQVPPLYRTDDLSKNGEYRYNHFVTGLPQHHIEGFLARQRQNKNGEIGVRRDSGGSLSLVGEVAMTLGTELRKGYVNDVVVLKSRSKDGAADSDLISGMDNGHIQIWRHGQLVRDIFHPTGCVDCLQIFMCDEKKYEDTSNESVRFVSSGKALISTWTEEGENIHRLPCPFGSTPNCLKTMHVSMDSAGKKPQSLFLLAASFRITHQTNPNRFRLVPQDEAGRRRRAQDEAEESQLVHNLARVSRTILVWSIYSRSSSSSGNGQYISSPEALVPPVENVISDSAPVTALVCLSLSSKNMPQNHEQREQGNERNNKVLVCGDKLGGLRIWKYQYNHRPIQDISTDTSTTTLSWEHLQLWKLTGNEDNSTKFCSIVCMQVIPNINLLAISTDLASGSESIVDSSDNLLSSITSTRELVGAQNILVPTLRAVFLMDVVNGSILSYLTAHTDAVQVMCSLPDGGLVTAGGKNDATLRVWTSSAISSKLNADNDIATNEEEQIHQQEQQRPNELTAESSILFDKLGYVMGLVVISDSKPGSKLFALAAVRYNVVKLCV